MKPDDQKFTGKGGGGRLTPNRKGERRGGRKKGTPNKISPALKRAVVQAASEAGDEINGQGLLGYFRMLAAEHPEVFARLLGKLMEAQERGRLRADRAAISRRP